MGLGIGLDYAKNFIKRFERFFKGTETALSSFNEDNESVSDVTWFNHVEGCFVLRYKAPAAFSNYDYLMVAHDGSSSDTVGMRVDSNGNLRGFVRAGSVNQHSSPNSDVQIVEQTQVAGFAWKSGEAYVLSGAMKDERTYSGDPAGMNELHFAARNGNNDASNLTVYDAEVGAVYQDPYSLSALMYEPDDILVGGGGQSLMVGYFDSQESNAESGKQTLRSTIGAEIGSNTVVFANGATGGSAAAKTSDDTNYWWDNAASKRGTALKTFYSNFREVGFRPNIILWSQGEQDSANIPSNTTPAEYKQALLSIFQDIRAEYGDIPIVIQKIGRRTTGYSNTGGYQAVRDVQNELIAEYDWIHDGAETYDLGLYTGDSMNVHLTDTAYDAAAQRNARIILDLLGYNLMGSVHGPVITDAVRDGTTVTVTISHDAGSDFTPTSAITGFVFHDDGASITINSAVRTDATTITLTLDSLPNGVEVLYYIYDNADVNISNIVKDNSPQALPLRPARIAL